MSGGRDKSAARGAEARADMAATVTAETRGSAASGDGSAARSADGYAKAYLVANPPVPNQAIIIDDELCIHCNKCVDVCHSDVMVKNPEKKQPPIVLYPDECWFCGCCVAHCPVQGAIKVEYPLHQRIGWKRKETGEYFRIGMKDPPPPNTRPPVG